MNTWGHDGADWAPDSEEARRAFGRLAAQECIRPEQFHQRSVARTGEQRLLLAILGDAVECLRPGRMATQREEARRWLMSGSTAPMSFRYVCDVLGLNAGAIRDGLARSLPPPVHQAWTEAEDALLRTHYPRKGTLYCARCLGRTREAIHSRAAVLGVVRHCRRAYSEAERATIRSLRGVVSINEIARRLNRTPVAIRTLAQRMARRVA